MARSPHRSAPDNIKEVTYCRMGERDVGGGVNGRRTSTQRPELLGMRSRELGGPPAHKNSRTATPESMPREDPGLQRSTGLRQDV
ncbi:hypothetical protein J6590_014262 [Homalodisca vitripennis]|nr:hypothetical protein J6590_014262 [Homalodisca vitripennis]